MKKKSIMVLATLLILAFGASVAMAGMWSGCGMWGGSGTRYTTNGSSGYYCPMTGTPGNYYCPMTGNGYCPMTVAPGSYYQTDVNAPTQNYTPSGGYYPATGWGCW